MSKTRGAKVKRVAKELRPSDVAWVRGFRQSSKARLGKPTLSDDELVGRRDSWAHYLETFWGVLGWELQRARTIEKIRSAFQPLSSKIPEHLMALILRPTAEIADSESIRKTKKEYGQSASREREVEEQRNAGAELVREANGAVFELGEKNREQLQTEIERRNANLREIRIRISNQRGGIRKVEMALGKCKPEDREALESGLNPLKIQLAKIQAEYTEEQKILKQIKERLAAITPERQKCVCEILAQRTAALDAMEREASEARKKSDELRERLSNQEAYYCRTELLKFIRAKRYAHNPRNLANALAGLPGMSCRRSATRCTKRPYTWGPSLIFQVFRFVEKTWRLRKPSKRESPPALFQAAIIKLAKTVLVKIEGEKSRKRRENYFRRYLEENWAYLKPAILDGVQSSAHPRQVPYLITAKFQENLSKPRTQADIFFAQQERLAAF